MTEWPAKLVVSIKTSLQAKNFTGVCFPRRANITICHTLYHNLGFDKCTLLTNFQPLKYSQLLSRQARSRPIIYLEQKSFAKFLRTNVVAEAGALSALIVFRSLGEPLFVTIRAAATADRSSYI